MKYRSFCSIRFDSGIHIHVDNGIHIVKNLKTVYLRKQYCVVVKAAVTSNVDFAQIDTRLGHRPDGRSQQQLLD